MARIYVASLSDYNSGILHGSWIELDGKDMEAIQAEIDAMLKASPAAAKYGDDAEEYAIHDYELPYGMEAGEYDNIAKLVERLEMLDELGDEAEAYIAYEAHVGAEYASLDDFRDVFRGHYESVTDYAESYCDDTGALNGMPENLQCYFNYEAFGRDMELSGDIWTAKAKEGGVYIFNNY